ncbi:hypothetical protein BLL42_21405 [Pseudomonas frederiksbergensis]|uniref:Uncharacterized protein n=1 Tax=Pseudomonas frederiksbergensis TaxID=104087 RepID=A0A1J0EQT0_9PSED|nr:hypothetical protein [Pseudomonas frederiksbergensis]APC18156.1 hypothetical protein BLL42_21405 [Pseudomonas frederiksbergensis]
MITTERLQLSLRVADRAMGHQRAVDDLVEAQRRLDQGYTDFFEEHGRPFDDRRPINPEVEEFLPVIDATRHLYIARCNARQAANTAKRRLKLAVRAVERYDADTTIQEAA